MCCAPLTSMNIKQTKKQVVITIVFLICFIVVSLLSKAFILTHTNHTHDYNGVGGTCAICAQLQNAENILKLLCMATIDGFTPAAWLYIATAIARAIYSNIPVLTPITAKTRMNN